MAFRIVTSDSDIMSSFIVPRGIAFNKKADKKCLEEVMCCWSRKWLMVAHISGNRTLRYGTQAEELSDGSKKNYMATYFGRLIR